MGDDPGEQCPLPDRRADERIRAILARPAVVAVVGMSPRAERPSGAIGRYLHAHGFTVVPVHPTADEIAGLPAYPRLETIPREVRVDIVDVVVSAEHAGPIADQAAAIGAGTLWFQPGAENPQAEARARQLGLEVIAGRCIMADHQRLVG